MENINQTDLLKSYFVALPTPVQEAILSSEIESKLRTLAETHKLHLDKWQILEAEVMFALLGVKPLRELSATIQKSLGLTETEATPLVTDISHIIFEPIRAEMERALGAPQAQEEIQSDIENIRTKLLAQEKTTLLSEHNAPDAPQVKSFVATPPAPQPTVQSIKTEIPPEARTGTSTERKSVTNDLYREQL